MTEENKNNPISRAVKALSLLEPNEQKATLVSALFYFILFASYYILRPVRDAMASDWTNTEVSFLWNINFLVSAVLISIYGFAVSKMSFRKVVPIMYGLFAVSFVTFYFLSGMIEDRVLADKAFYVWVSVFALFHASVFWMFMADTFNSDQAKRSFAIIALGATLGTPTGALIATFFAERIGWENLTLIASVGLVSVIPLIFWLYGLKTAELGNEDLEADKATAVVGGQWWKGFSAVIGNRYLLWIAIFILLYVFIGSFYYFMQKNLLEDFTRDERTSILGLVDLCVTVLTFALAFFATGRIVSRLGMPVALALMPLLVAVCMLILAVAPILVVFLAMQVFRRGGNYGLTRPAREMLYTRGVTREERFKAKPVVDIVVYRGGDALSGTLFAFLTDGIGLGLAAVAAVGAGIAAVWGSVGAKLGRMFESKEGTSS